MGEGDTEQASWRDALVESTSRGLAKRGRPRHFPKGTTIFAQGDAGDDMLILATGQVELSTVSMGGKKMVLALLGPRDILGEVALLDRGTRSATAVAVSEVTGNALSFADFRAFLMEDPEVHFALTVELCGKLRRANAMLEDQTQTQGAARLARAILRLAEKFGRDAGGEIEIPVSLSQSEIGDLSGLTRANVNRYLRAWAKDGYVAFDKSGLSVLDRQSLEELADS